MGARRDAFGRLLDDGDGQPNDSVNHGDPTQFARKAGARTSWLSYAAAVMAVGSLVGVFVFGWGAVVGFFFAVGLARAASRVAAASNGEIVTGRANVVAKVVGWIGAVMAVLLVLLALVLLVASLVVGSFGEPVPEDVSPSPSVPVGEVFPYSEGGFGSGFGSGTGVGS